MRIFTGTGESSFAIASSPANGSLSPTTRQSIVGHTQILLIGESEVNFSIPIISIPTIQEGLNWIESVSTASIAFILIQSKIDAEELQNFAMALKSQNINCPIIGNKEYSTQNSNFIDLISFPLTVKELEKLVEKFPFKDESKISLAVIINDSQLDREILVGFLKDFNPDIKILEISDTMRGYSVRDLEKYKPAPNVLLFVEDLYLQQSEYLRNSLMDSNSGPAAIISDSEELFVEFPNLATVKLIIRPFTKNDVMKIIKKPTKSLVPRLSMSRKVGTKLGEIIAKNRSNSKSVELGGSKLNDTKINADTDCEEEWNLNAPSNPLIQVADITSEDMLQMESNRSHAIGVASCSINLDPYYSTFPINVLYIDDDPLSLNVLRVFFQKISKFITFVQATNSELASKLPQHTSFDLIFVALDLKASAGSDIAEQIRLGGFLY